MPQSINGTGTMWYGNALFEPDGSYIVTEWITILWLPIFPVGSKRVRSTVNNENNAKPWWRREINTRYYQTIHVPLYRPHLYKGYAVTFGFLLVLLLADYLKL